MKPVAAVAPRTTRGSSENLIVATTAPPVSGTLRLQPQFKSIGAAAAEAGLSASAIRFYERRGLVCPPRAQGRRWFGPDERARLAMIARFRAAGFSLIETAALLSPSRHAGEGWRAAGAAAASRLRQEIAERQTALERLTALEACACRDPMTCTAAA